MAGELLKWVDKKGGILERIYWIEKVGGRGRKERLWDGV
jgi:hypothetical protein